MEQKVVRVVSSCSELYERKEMEGINAEIARLNGEGWRVVQIVIYPIVGGDFPALFALIQRS